MAQTVWSQMDFMRSKGGQNRVRSEGNSEELDPQDLS